jgi:hypothetical protein
MSEKEVTKKEMLKEFAFLSGGRLCDAKYTYEEAEIKRIKLIHDAIHRLIENMDKKASREFIRELTGAIFAEFDEDEHEGIFCCPSDIEKILIKGIAELGLEVEEEEKKG